MPPILKQRCCLEATERVQRLTPAIELKVYGMGVQGVLTAVCPRKTKRVDVDVGEAASPEARVRRRHGDRSGEKTRPGAPWGGGGQERGGSRKSSCVCLMILMMI